MIPLSIDGYRRYFDKIVARLNLKPKTGDDEAEARYTPYSIRRGAAERAHQKMWNEIG